MSKSSWVILGGVVVGFALSASGEGLPAENLLREEIVARELLAAEKREWTLEKDWIERRIALLEREKAALADEIDVLQNRVVEEEEALREVRTEHRGILREREVLMEFFSQEGPLLAELIDTLPIRRETGWERPLDRLRRAAEGVSEEALLPTMRAHLALLQDLDRRDGRWQRQRSLIQLQGESNEREMEVLWMGLAHAWFQASDGSVAGRGYRGSEGLWVWESVADEKQSIQQLFAIHAGREAARWVTLKVAGEGIVDE